MTDDFYAIWFFVLMGIMAVVALRFTAAERKDEDRRERGARFNEVLRMETERRRQLSADELMAEFSLSQEEQLRLLRERYGLPRSVV